MKQTILYSPKQGEKMKSYRVVYVDRKTGRQEITDTEISLYDAEVIDKQIELSTSKTVVLLKEIARR